MWILLFQITRIAFSLRPLYVEASRCATCGPIYAQMKTVVNTLTDERDMHDAKIMNQRHPTLLFRL